MTEQDYTVREIFAYYGRTVYLAQLIEKGILNLIVSSRNERGITKTRHEEILHEKSLLPFGQLSRDIIELDCFSSLEIEVIEKFHLKRDFLVHSFWWERPVEFNSESLQQKLLIELNDLTEFLESVNLLVQNKMKSLIHKYNIDVDGIRDELMAEGKTIPFKSFRKLSKNETVIDLFPYRNSEQSLIPIFELGDNTFWTVCDIGLTFYEFEIIQANKSRFKDLEGFLPIGQFNPRPKVENPWNYELDLKKKGLIMYISKKDIESPMKWKIGK